MNDGSKKKPQRTKRRAVDWESIEREYRAGQLSVREISEQHKCSHVGIAKRAKKFGWTRNLAAQVRSEIESKLAADAVEPTTVSAAAAQEIIQSAAARGVEVVRQHRSSLQHGHTLVKQLFTQLEEAAAHREEIEETIQQVTAGDKDERRLNTMLKAVALPSHAAVIRDLSSALGRLVVLERQAFGIDGRNTEVGHSGVLRVPAQVSESEWEQQ